MKYVHFTLLICLVVSWLICPGCISSPTAQLEENKVLVRRWMEEPFNENWATLDELLSPDYVWHQAGRSEPLRREEAENFMRAFVDAFPDNSITIEDMIAEGDKVVTRYTVSGTHKGDFMGIPATGKEITFTAICISQVSDDRIIEEWDEGDVLGFMQQLGAIPSD